MWFKSRSTKNFKKNLFKIFFLCFSDHFNVLMSKIIFLKKYDFNTFLNEKHFHQQPQPQPLS